MGGHRLRAGIIGGLGVPRENDNGRRVIYFCTERELCEGNTSRTRVCLSTPGW